MPEAISLISGPGCPVCVSSQQEIDKFIEVAKIKKTIVSTFGDLMRVPGTHSTLLRERADGADVRVVYSTLDCLQIAEKNPGREVVFWGVGFETTAPTIAAAQKKGIKNFSVISAHKLVPPALTALLENDAVQVNGFICPGHVSVIIGAKAYEPIVHKYNVPCVIAGFEPVDILPSILVFVEQIEQKSARVEIAYNRTVSYKGNAKAMEVLFQVFEPVDANWRGLGPIPQSALKIRANFADFDTEKRSSWTCRQQKNQQAVPAEKY